MTIGSLFSGIGGIELGLESIGLGPTIWQAEQNEYARKVLAKNWPGVPCFDDVRKIDESTERPTILCGGFPCQGISTAGHKRGLADERSGLWSEFARIIRTLRPRYVFVKNVAAIARRGLGTVLGDLAAFGFNAEWGVLGACAAGASHTRDRLFILAYSDSEHGETWLRIRGTHQRALPTFNGTKMPPDVRVESNRELDGMGHGLRREVDRLRCLGNAVVPQVAALAFVKLLERATEAAR